MSWYRGAGSPEAYDEHYDKWLLKTRRQAENPWPFKILMVKKTWGLVLDAGCGPGILNRFIENGVFLDFSKVVLMKRWVGKKRRRVLASAEDMPFRNDVFDSVIATELIEHTDKPERFVREVHRVLKKNGLFTFSFPWSDITPTHHFKKVSKKIIHEWINPPFTKYEYDVPPLMKERGMVYAYK